MWSLTAAVKAYHISRWIQEKAQRTYLVVATGTKEAATLQRDLAFFLGPLGEGEVCLFPPHDALPFSSLSPHPEILCERMKTLWRLKQKVPPTVIITTAPALLEHLPPQDLLESWSLQVDEEVSRQDFLQRLPEWGYQNASLVTELGNYAIRGGLVDLYCPLYRHPLRIEWLGDQVVSIRLFNPKTQTTEEKLEHVEIIPVREVLLTQRQRHLFVKQVRSLAETHDIPKSIWGPLLDKVKLGIPFSGIETYLTLFYETTTSLWDWLPSNTTVLLESEESLKPLLEEHLQEIAALQKATDFLPASAVRYSLEDFHQALGKLPLNRYQKQSWESPALEIHTELRPALEKAKRRPDSGNAHPLEPLTSRLEAWREQEQVYLVASSETQAHRLIDLLQGYDDSLVVEKYFLEVPPSGKPDSGKIKVIIGDLSSGFRIPGKINFVTEEEIFGPKVRRLAKRESVFDLSSLASLKIGDAVVHKQHGICLYQGLVHLDFEGVANDFVLLEFREGDKLYLPVYRMNLISRYVGGDNRPRLDKLGGTSWETVKKKAQKAIQEMAGELLNLYAARKAGKGFAFSPPNETFEAFEASFPFEETPDQERAIADVMGDMQSERPMDRLVLGDVGYGKTEVAMRAAFKAVLDGKQVAILVPTTLLAAQHYERFVERFKDYPVIIDMLSRFRSPAEQKATLKKLAEKKVDIVIGTHRLLQPDVSFRDLGLLVVDEEHRFGVSHKEKIKRLRKDIDVLALSATPIPRTLHLSMVGMRAISIIETPPTDRLSIRTFVLRFEAEVLREAILREIKRGGQVFFVHNKIESIGALRDKLRELVPEIKIEIAHGQMEEEELERIMIRFSHHEFDLLLCTTIIESGIDIATANTILINKAEQMGLAQIYQLRGRVGRGGHRAYAYLIVSEGENLTPEAAKRLEALQRFTELGSGFKLASYDLEIRGAGSLLGEKQSGHMAALGFELYTEMLQETLRLMKGNLPKGEHILEGIDPEFHFKIPAYIPESYINDPSIRLEWYRRLASLELEEEIDPITDEMIDRFGPIPPETKNLLEISSLNTHAKKLRVKQLRFDGKTFVYAFDLHSPLAPDVLLARIRKEPKKYRLTPDSRLIVHQPFSQVEDALVAAKKLLRELGLHVSVAPR